MSLVGLLGCKELAGCAPSWRALPRMLAAETERFLARAATSVQQAESSHPSECGERVVCLTCAGASMMQLTFDARSWLSRGSSLGLYLDAACTREVRRHAGRPCREGLSTCGQTPSSRRAHAELTPRLRGGPPEISERARPEPTSV